MYFVPILKNMLGKIVKCISKNAKFAHLTRLICSTPWVKILMKIDENNKKLPLCTNLPTHLALVAFSNPCFQSDAIEAYQPNEGTRANSIGRPINGLEYFLSQLL